MGGTNATVEEKLLEVGVRYQKYAEVVREVIVDGVTKYYIVER